MQFLKQSTTISLKLGPFVDSTDGYTAETALTPTVKLSKAGGALAARNSATATAHDADGYYTVELNTTDTNTAGRLLATVAGSSTHLAVWGEYMVLPANVFDSLVGGTDTLNVDVTQFGGTNGVFSGGYPEVNAAQFGGVAGTFSGGRPEVNTTHAAGTAWGSGAITAASIASNAITAAKVAANTVGSAQIAANAIQASHIDTAAITSGKFDAGAITATVLATDCINATKIATGAIDADALATDAVSEIADGILSRNVSNVEGSAAEHTLCTLILALLEHSISGTTLTIKRTDGSTTHYTKTLTTSTSTDTITAIT